MIRRYRLLIGALGLLALLLVSYLAGRCDKSGGPSRPERTEIITPDELEIPLALPPSERGFGERTFRRSSEIRARGVTEEPTGQADVDSFVAAVGDTVGPPKFMTFAGEYNKNRLALEAIRSDGRLERREFSCRQPCRFGGADTLLYASEPRFRFPWLIPVARCAAFAAAGGGLAYLADYSRPELAAAASGGACVVFELTR